MVDLFAKKFWTTSVLATTFWQHWVQSALRGSRRKNWNCLSIPWLNSKGYSSSASSKHPAPFLNLCCHS